MKKLIPVLRDTGYVAASPSCKDCDWAKDESQGLFCDFALCLVEKEARCLMWSASKNWLRANPEVADKYIRFHEETGLSAAEQAYANKAHALFVK